MQLFDSEIVDVRKFMEDYFKISFEDLHLPE